MRKLALSFVSFVLFSSPLAHADQIQLLDRGDQSLAAFHASISGARRSIDMATYVFEACDSAPKLLLDAMVKKARAGVHVRLLLDAYSLKPAAKAALPAYLAGVPNFELRYYNDAATLVGNNMRSHIKAFVVDGRRYIVGGRNMQDDYFGLGSKLNYVDQDLLVTGASAASAQALYNELWAAGSQPGGFFGGLFGGGGAAGDARAFAANCLAPTARDQRVAEFVAKRGAALLAERPVRSCAVEYTLDNPSFDFCPTCGNEGREGGAEGRGDYLTAERLQKKRMTGMFLHFVNGARSRLELLNQYYLPLYRTDDALASLRERRVPVEVISNATGDIESQSQNRSFTCYIQSSAVRTSTGSQRVSLLTSRGSLHDRWELSPAAASWRIHAKSAIRDGQDVLVSSYNLDPRSYATNLESGAVVSDCAALASDLEASYERLRANVKADRSCAACAAEFVPANQNPNASCGGIPDLY